MAEKLLVDYDSTQVLEESKRILEENGSLPTNCPKKTCLRLRGINLTHGEIRVLINADPPQLPTEKSWLNYEIDPICAEQCQILGNPNRGFEVKQSSKTGTVISAEGQWDC